MFFHTFSPAERIPSRAALQLCSIYKDRSMICFSLLLQMSHILVKQIFTASAHRPVRKRASVVWSGTGSSSKSHMKSTRYRQASSSFRLE